MPQARSKTPYIFFFIALALSLVVVFLVVDRCSSQSDNIETTDSADKPTTEPLDIPKDDEMDNADTGHAGTPQELVDNISRVMLEANKTGDINPLLQILGKSNLSADQTKRLHDLASKSRLKLDQNTPYGKAQDSNQLWYLNLTDKSKIKLNIVQSSDGKWRVKDITLPKKGTTANTPAGIDPLDPAHPQHPHHVPNIEGAASAEVKDFLQSILKFDPATARKHIDSSQISYAKLAGLCIIFEEGKYRLAPQKPLRNMFSRDTTSGWITRVVSDQGKNSAMFAINAKRKDANSPWKITEINLDSLLTDYAKRVSGGDIHYAPLIKDPKGGDSLAIYFDLNSNSLIPRTQRQLTIVARLLKTDPNKKLTISGHTDSLGSDDYNLALSAKRARQVKEFLVIKGVPAAQILIEAHGKKLPRVPNTSNDGTDSPDGRRANRRAEILLDF